MGIEGVAGRPERVGQNGRSFFWAKRKTFFFMDVPLLVGLNLKPRGKSTVLGFGSSILGTKHDKT